MKILLLALLAVCAGPVQALTFEQIKMLYERRVAEIETEETSQKTKLAESYTEQLTALLGRFTAAAKLENALAVKAEIERAEEGTVFEEPEFDKLKNSELAALRGRFEVQLKRIVNEHDREQVEAVKRYMRLLEEEVVALTRDGKLEEAVKVRDELNKVGGTLPKESAPESTGVDLDAALTGTRWTWVPEAGSAEGKTLYMEFGAKGEWLALWRKSLGGVDKGSWKVVDERTVKVELKDWKGGAMIFLDEDLASYRATLGKSKVTAATGEKVESKAE